MIVVDASVFIDLTNGHIFEKPASHKRIKNQIYNLLQDKGLNETTA